jgi:3,4-dihydroxy 2-butanone 4-phosphate synthase/GTP cyclohydrolase II
MKTPFDSIESVIADLRKGRMVIVVDDADRENEGDLIMAAEHVTPAAINFMAKFGRGLICVPTTEERLKQLGIERMVRRISRSAWTRREELRRASAPPTGRKRFA